MFFVICYNDGKSRNKQKKGKGSMSIKNLKEQEKESRGITLIVLLITIIVLLILAGITIVFLTSDNGILNKADKASEETNKQTATEMINLKITNAQIESYSKTQQMPTLQFLADNLCEDEEIEYVALTTQKIATLVEGKQKSITVGESKSIFTKLTEYPYEFEIDGNLRLASINGVKIAEQDTEKIDELEKEIKDLKELCQNLKSESTKPVGSLISYMGNHAPDGYLPCNGQVYNISEYSDLAEQIKKEFGKYNYYGGNGTTTFATPNLTGKFLKGSNQAGVSQEAGLPNISGAFHVYAWGSAHSTGAFDNAIKARNQLTSGTTPEFNYHEYEFDASRSSSIYGKSTTVTPENMSVLYCIKY